MTKTKQTIYDAKTKTKTTIEVDEVIVPEPEQKRIDKYRELIAKAKTSDEKLNLLLEYFELI